MHRGPDGQRVWRGDVAMAIAGLAVAAGLALALWPRPTPTAVTSPSAAAVDRPALSVAGRPVAVYIGDGYTSGSGLAETSYGCLAATRMGWLCKAASEAETGYISGGPANRFAREDGFGQSTSFDERIARMADRYDPDVVILDGGRDDVFAEPKERFEATVRTIAQARRTWPDARIVFVAPRFLDKPRDDLGIDDEVIDLIRESSGVKNLVVVDPIAGFDKTDTAALIARDGTDPVQAAPNQEGERALGAALAAAMSREGLRPTT
jgi:hypothetical protein